MAAGGASVVLYVAVNVFHMEIEVLPLVAVVGFILAYNVAFYFYHRHVEVRKDGLSLVRDARIFANIQIAVDLMSLGLLIHFSGGIENPFIFYFVFHMAISSILLSRKASYLQATFSAGIVAAITVLEYGGIVRHYHVAGFGDPEAYNAPIYAISRLFVLTTTLYLIVYMATSISNDLRKRRLELQEANERLAAQDRLKSQYVFRVSHDIQAHLAAIHSCLAPVLAGITGNVDSDQCELLRRAKRRTESLLRFVKSLLKLTSARLKEDLEAQELELENVIRRSVELLSEQARKKRITVDCSVAGHCRLVWDESALEEVMVSLLSNSIKYTPNGGSIRIAAEDCGGCVTVRVSDNGIGISRDELDQVFDEFYRSKSAREVEREGTGLGLAIAKYIIERRGGRIWAESDGEGKGATFTFELRRDEADA